MHHQIIHNAKDNTKGNIWLFWNSSLTAPVVVDMTSQCITVEVGGVLVTGVHAISYAINRRELWKNLCDISLLDKPWLILGDFNTVLSMDEKKGGRNHVSSDVKDFQDCVDYYGLLQAPKSGLDFSWCNGRVGKKRILCNLDRALYNLKWLDKFNGWHYHTGTRDLKKILKIWNWEVFGDVNENLKKAEDNVMEATIQSDTDPSKVEILNKLVTARGEYEMAANNYNTLLRDKARMNWIQEGDINTQFFHTSIKLRQMQNFITELENSTEHILLINKGADVLVDYFSQKFAHQDVVINDSFLEAVPKVINTEDNSFLEEIPTEADIKKAIFELNQDGAPGPDGFTGYLYRFS
ncbi:uncharacterized protein LOC113305668 [Papaver somniferum]|uniref:uncharacterized protein LOC113305668 n=1 Tax=Papaver somniferum TaxID=3469 RepID=UPI000E700554|nr:uncharacterized protein LOC113305668 [Papaver somniferum]